MQQCVSYGVARYHFGQRLAIFGVFSKPQKQSTGHYNTNSKEDIYKITSEIIQLNRNEGWLTFSMALHYYHS
jgi:hypothetical protein